MEADGLQAVRKIWEQRILVVTPTYNERDNLPEFVSRVWQAVPGAHILVVDDNSPDGTGELADQLAERHPDRLFVLHRERKAGLGRAYVAGFQWALRAGYDAIVQLDADLSHDPAEIPLLLSGLAEAWLVLGSRYVNGVRVLNWDVKRLLLSWSASLYVRIFTGMPFTDPTGGFKCWRREALMAIDLDHLFANGYIFQVETTFELWHRGFEIREAPIVFTERQIGESKMDLAIIREAAFGVLRIAARRWTPIPRRA